MNPAIAILGFDPKEVVERAKQSGAITIRRDNTPTKELRDYDRKAYERRKEALRARGLNTAGRPILQSNNNKQQTQ